MTWEEFKNEVDRKLKDKGIPEAIPVRYITASHPEVFTIDVDLEDSRVCGHYIAISG